MCWRFGYERRFGKLVELWNFVLLESCPGGILVERDLFLGMSLPPCLDDEFFSGN